MRFLVVGAGAIGGYLGAKIAHAGGDVTLFARGPHLAALQARGLRIIDKDGGFEVRPRVIASLGDAGPMDFVFLGVKATGLTGLAPQLAPLIGDNTTVVSTQNGIPWWYFQAGPGAVPGLRLERVDPGGAIAAAIPYARVVGSIAYFATEIAQPGVIRLIEGNRLTLGEPDEVASERTRVLAQVLIDAGLRVPVTQRLRTEIWVKLLGNAVFNPISALTRATLVRITSEDAMLPVVRGAMAEVAAVAGRLGITMPISLDQRIAGARAVGEHKTSMLQDIEAGRPLELEALCGSVVELAARLEVPVPHLECIYGCTRLLAASTTGAVAAEGKR